MNEIEYKDFFEQLGIKIEPLPKNYNPDMFGKKLMSDYPLAKGVLYSANTNFVCENTNKEYIY